ncbi:type III PLP-dependent enzyme domain-containing protein [Aliiglaciecola lipolytica]|uniref:Lysine/ornithine decarboxylase n=1 Tax=Aliiglaciecola lipolytica E3 TaxID=1127673 RepID=K6YFG6_9ALTE|nr:lysine/ornithine decarboxylase [Aliiglaciecola lipolytica]GAC16887.1 lysine/ornithine decarboxylase [Aliiglaciecola lipolytica E3]
MFKKQNIVQLAIKNNILNDEVTAIGVSDFDGLKQTVADLNSAFPDPFFHTFAVKANALVEILRELKSLGMGAEVASPGELLIAQKAGFESNETIFDSPAKTLSDLSQCIEHHISINIDNLQELERVDHLKAKFPDSKSIIGFRINPQSGSGSISSTSTATATSKFGYALADGNNREQLMDIYKQRPWLTSLHTHSGSQGCELELMALGIKELVLLAEDINQYVGFQQIKQLDIGGGLPVNFASDDVNPSFQQYADVLKQTVPLLFSGKYRVKTEFGRAITAKNGFILTRVEYTKSMGGRHIAITHAGAQILTRTAFSPNSWPLRVSCFDSKGQIRTEENTETVQTDVAGPCCFAGDLVCEDKLLPKLEANDYVLIHDTGGYYFSNHFDYNSLPRVSVYAVRETEHALDISCIRKQDTLEQVLARM